MEQILTAQQQQINAGVKQAIDILRNIIPLQRIEELEAHKAFLRVEDDEDASDKPYMEWEESKDLLDNLCEALEYLHRANGTRLSFEQAKYPEAF